MCVRERERKMTRQKERGTGRKSEGARKIERERERDIGLFINAR